ncbi:hypothetical protein [Clostridium intestinale]|uniref:Uncharacterized protein n=1 Tax=Clostridium intestinale URNW TaxID=1294142 RepID=U2NQW5_9CLOT|nr:hypothetical protein [Clostridium intestinale]ERK31538.1 hypothetical protein CINTURNW_1114 [Clostridium intestinale URNW]
MKVIAKSIDVIAWFTESGEPSPIRFRMKNEDQSTTIIKVDKVIFKEKEKLAGNPMLVFRCQSMINKINKIYELKYEIQTCKWTLFKI